MALLQRVTGADQERTNTPKQTPPIAWVGLEQIDDHRQQGGGEQDLDDRLVELLEELLPERLARQRRQVVDAERLPALRDGGGGQAVVDG